MDDDGLVLRVEDDHLEQTAGSVRTDDQQPVVALPNESERDTAGRMDVLIGNPVPPRADGNLHIRQGNLSHPSLTVC